MTKPVAPTRPNFTSWRNVRCPSRPARKRDEVFGLESASAQDPQSLVALARRDGGYAAPGRSRRARADTRRTARVPPRPRSAPRPRRSAPSPPVSPRARRPRPAGRPRSPSRRRPRRRSRDPPRRDRRAARTRMQRRPPRRAATMRTICGSQTSTAARTRPGAPRAPSASASMPGQNSGTSNAIVESPQATPKPSPCPIVMARSMRGRSLPGLRAGLAGSSPPEGREGAVELREIADHDAAHPRAPQASCVVVMPTTGMPAARAASIPAGASSNATHASGAHAEQSRPGEEGLRIGLARARPRRRTPWRPGSAARPRASRRSRERAMSGRDDPPAAGRQAREQLGRAAHQPRGRRCRPPPPHRAARPRPRRRRPGRPRG